MQTDLTAIRREVMRDFSWSFRKSWSYFVPEFQQGSEYLQSLSDPAESGELIWKTENNTVRKIQLPESAGGWEIVYKQVRPVYRLRYLFQMTLAGKEAVNYYMLGKAGFPMAQLLGVGEERRNCLIKKAFFITRFASGYQDGRVFHHEQGRNAHPYLDEFIRNSLRYLARMHDMNFLHCGFKIYNILWQKEDETSPMDFVWIDMATGRLISSWRMRMSAKRDLGAFFESLDMPEEKITPYIDYYCSCRRTSLPGNMAKQIEEYLQYRKRLWIAKHTGLRLKWRQFKRRHFC